MHNIPNVDDVIAEWVDRDCGRLGGRLHKLDLVALRITYIKPLAAIARLFDASRHRDAVLAEIFLQAFCVSGVKRYVIQPVDRAVSGRQRQHFHKLDGAEVIADPGSILRIWPLHSTQIMDVEVFSLGCVRTVDADMGNPTDQWPAVGSLRRRQRCGKQCYDGESSYFMDHLRKPLGRW